MLPILRAPPLLLTLAMLLWSGNILLGRAMNLAFTPIQLNFWRWAIAFGILLAFTGRGLWRKRAVLRRDWLVLCGLGGMGIALFNWVLYSAVATTTATNTALLYTNVPLFIAAVSWAFLGERLGARQWLGIVVSMFGVLGIVTRGEPALLLQLRFNTGDLYALATVPVWGLYTIWLRRRPPELTPMELMTAIVGIGLTVVGPLYLWEHAQGLEVQWDWRTVGTVAYLTVVASIVCYLLWNAGVARLGASRAGLYAHLYPLFVAGLEVLLLGEALHVYHATGAALIFAGLALTTAGKSAVAPSAAMAAATAVNERVTVDDRAEPEAPTETPPPVPPPTASPPTASPTAASPTAASPLAGHSRLWAFLLSPALLLVLNMLFWSGNWIVARGLRTQYTPLGLNFWRWTLALAWLLPFTAPHLWRARAAIRRDWLVLTAMGVTGIAVFNILVYLSTSQTTATNGVLIASSTPVVIVPLAWIFLREKITLRQAAGIALSMVGVLAIITRGDPGRLLELKFNAGDLWALVSVPVWALYAVLLRRRPPELGSMSLLTVLVGIGVLAMLPFSLWTHARAPQISLSLEMMGALFYLALFSSLLAVAFFNYGVAKLGPNVAGLFIHLVPVFTVGLAWQFLGELPRLYHGVGIALVFVGIVLTTTGRRSAVG